MIKHLVGALTQVDLLTLNAVVERVSKRKDYWAIEKIRIVSVEESSREETFYHVVPVVSYDDLAAPRNPPQKELHAIVRVELDRRERCNNLGSDDWRIHIRFLNREKARQIMKSLN